MRSPGDEPRAEPRPPRQTTCKQQAGTFVEYLSRPRTLLKFFNRFVRQVKSDVIDDDGNVILKEDAKYNEDGVRALY